MGITGAHELSYLVSGLSLQDIYSICSFVRQQQQLDIQPTIDLDASLLYRSSKLSVDNRMAQLVDMSCLLACIGFSVFIICDGAEQHHTKRASVERQSTSFVNKVKSYLLKVQLMSITERKCSATEAAEKVALATEENKVCNDIKKYDKKLEHASVDVGQDFFRSMETNIPEANLGKKKGKVSVLQAEYQADLLLAYRRVNYISDVEFSCDSDLLAHAGAMC